MHREETLKPKGDEPNSVFSSKHAMYGGVKPVDVHQAECDATWPSFHGSVVKLIESGDTGGEPRTHRADRVERIVRKTSGEPKECHAKDGKTSIVATQEKRVTGAWCHGYGSLRCGTRREYEAKAPSSGVSCVGRDCKAKEPPWQYVIHVSAC